MINASTLEILGDGEQIRDFLFIDDALDETELVAGRGLDGETHHLGSGNPISILQLANLIIKGNEFTRC